MAGNISGTLSALADWRRDWRRRRNLARAGRSMPPARRIAGCMAGLLFSAAGALAITTHVARLEAQAGQAPATRAAALQAALPGIRFAVPEKAGAYASTVAGGRLLVVAGMQAQAPVRIDLCSHPLPLHAGYRFAEASGQVALRRALLAGDDSMIPALTISAGDGQMRVRWRARGSPVHWQGDLAGDAMRAQGWLVWREGALRVLRSSSARCPEGELQLQAFMLPPTRTARADASTAEAHVIAFPAGGAALAMRLPPGEYQVPALSARALEDEILFKRVVDRGLLRVAGNGLLELAPPDLANWLAAGEAARAAPLEAWGGQSADRELRALLKRLYRQADGEYVRQQVDLYNSERRLLAWRLAEGTTAGVTVHAHAAGGGLLGQSAGMPPVAVRLFADLPQGWQPWSRAAHWRGDDTLTLEVRLPQPASGREAIRLMVAGNLTGVHASGTPACTGRACRAAGDVRVLVLRPEPGARSIPVQVRALDMSQALNPGDQAYRHIRLAGGKLSWQRAAGRNGLPAASGRGGEVPAQGMQVEDRAGRLLWSDGAALPAAHDAGMAAMLGLAPGHSASIAGMMARAGAMGEPAQRVRLSIELPLQALGQAILECQGLRGGVWHQGACSGGSAPPAQRRAGLVLMDAETGDILLAANAGAPRAAAANWREVRDFDRANPAGSPLRLPAWQHDGGAHSSPGSSFKMVSALGLEMAAGRDPALGRLLGGQPLRDMDAAAGARGFAFRSDAATYPFARGGAHVTNYREQSLLRRAEEGRLGLAQALTHSVNTWFAWLAEMSDATLQGRPDGGAPGLRALEPGVLEARRPVAAAAGLLGFGRPMRLDGGLLPGDFPWAPYDVLQTTPSRIDPIDTRHEVRQMAIGLRMQATPLQMAVAAAAIGTGRVPEPRLLLELDGKGADDARGAPLPVRLDRIRAGMKGVVDKGTAAGAFAGPALASARRGLYGKTGTAPVSEEAGTVWFSGWLAAGSLPGQDRTLAFAVFASHSQLTGGGHAAPVVAALFRAMAAQSAEQSGKPAVIAANGRAGAMP